MASEKKLAQIIEQILNIELKKKKDIDTLTNEIEKSFSGIDNSQNLSKQLMNTIEDNSNGTIVQGYVQSNTVPLSPGQVWVKNNEVYVEGLPGYNTLPCVKPTKGVELFINGKLIKDKTVVSEQDSIHVELQTNEKPFLLTINISEDGLTAYMTVQLKTETKYTLLEQPPKQSLVLVTTANTTKYCPIGMDEILDALKNEGINYGIDYPAIQQFLANPNDGKYVIARGTPPAGSKDDTVDVLFPEKVIKRQYSTNDKADFFNFNSIPSVDTGNLLAVKRDGEMGQPGISVLGDIILPLEPRKITIRAGKGAKVEENMVYSTISGRPMVKKIGPVWLFYLEPYLRHFGDINLSTGNQNFRGNIEVFGDVCDGMTVRAGGNLQIVGCINQAKVMAIESVQAGKCVGALVQAGGDSHYTGKCYFTLQELYTNLENLSKVVGMLLNNSQLNKYQNQLSQIFLLLIEKKFTRIPNLLKDAVHFLEITPMVMPNEIETLIEMIREHVPPRNLNLKKIQLLLEYIEMAQNYFSQLTDNPADIQVGYASNSMIAATNDVYIGQKGCINTKITAGRNVSIGGVIRGGEISAKGTITVVEAGSEIGTRTVLKTESHEIKILKKIYDGVIINIGGCKLEITQTMGPVKFYNHDGQKISIIH